MKKSGTKARIFETFFRKSPDKIEDKTKEQFSNF